MNATTTSSKPKATLLDLDSLLDTKMDSVETLPDYMNPPPGLYVLECTDAKIEKYKVKEDGKETGAMGNRIKLTYKVVETVEVIEGELPVPDGTLFTEGFQGTKEGLEYCKKACSRILGISTFEDATLGEILDGAKGSQFKCRITVKKSSVNGKEYENLQLRAVAE